MRNNFLSRGRRTTVPIAVLGAAAVVSLLVAFFGNGALRTASTATAIVCAIVVVLVLLAERARLRHEQETRRELLTRYCEFVIDNRMTPLVSVENWHQKVHIQPNGDVREIVMIKAVALRDEVYFIRFHLGSEWPQPEKYRRHVRVRANSVRVNGAPGPEWTLTNTWISDAKLKTIVHFRSPVRRGDEMRIEMERYWPAKCLPLMRDGAAERFVFRTTELLRIRRLEYQVILPNGFEATYEPIGLTTPDNQLSVDGYTDIEGRRVVICRATELPERSTVGMRLALA